MRVINFRVLYAHPELGEDEHDPFWHYFGVGSAFDVFRADDITISQFTGLLDRNGKEIYEGDLVIHDKLGELEVIYFQSNCQFMLNSEYGESINGQLIEVIGNIYENKGE